MAHSWRYLALFLAIVPGVAGLASAQEPSPSPSPAASDEVVRFADEVTVTAQKRKERVVDVPFTVTAFDSGLLEVTGIRSLDEAAKATPAVHFETVGVSRPQSSVRGIGTGAFDAGSDPSVPVYVDEVYITRFAGMTYDLFDLERVEILKGPQGTLFGRNAAGGAIGIVTRKPAEKTSARLQIGAGDLSAFNAAGTLNGVLSPDRVFGRVTAAYKRRDGYSLNLTTNSLENDVDSLGARGALRVRAGEKLEILISGDYARDRLAMWANENTTPNVFLLFPPLAAVYAPTPDKYSEPYTRSGWQDRDLWGATVRLDWATGPAVLTSITAFRHSELDEYQDLDASLADSADRRAGETDRAFSQELRLANTTDRLSWIAGLYYLRETTDRIDDLVLGPDDVLSWVFNSRAAFTVTWTDTFETDSYALFGQATLGLGRKLNLTLGGRYSRDEKSVDRDARNGGVASPLLPLDYTAAPSDSWASFDPVAILQYRFGPDAQAYASYREGFKSGGFQYAASTARAASTTFDPEHVKTFELGGKYLSSSRRVSLSGALFWNDYRDMQFLAATGTQAGAPLTIITNAGQSTAKGFEAQAVARPTQGLELSVGYGFVDAKFDEYVDGNGKNQAGHQLVRTPRNSVSASAQYNHTFADAGVLVVRGEWNYKDRLWFDPDNILNQPAYYLFNARISFATLKHGWELAAWGKNLSDKLYYQNIIALSASAVGLGTVAVPRTLGVSLTKTF